MQDICVGKEVSNLVYLCEKLEKIDKSIIDGDGKYTWIRHRETLNLIYEQRKRLQKFCSFKSSC
jgi:hypothetical protein